MVATLRNSPAELEQWCLRQTIKLLGRTVAIAGMVCGLFLLTTLAFNLPKSLCFSLGSTFLVVTAIDWIFHFKSPQQLFAQLTRLLLTWAAAASILFAAVFYLDRAGWLWFRLTGYDVVLNEELAHLNDTSACEFVAREPWFSIDPEDSNCVVLPAGTYDVRHTIVVPAKTALTIEPGTVLRFSAGRSLISYSPITARGTPNKPIAFTARNAWFKWGVVGVVDSDKSVFEHVRFKDSRCAVVNDTTLPGSLSLINADAVIRHSLFHNLYGKDAVYVRHGKALIQHNSFRDVYKDGVDFDSGSGEISHNHFVNCRDEGIDLSDSWEANVFNNTVLDAKGGRIGSDHGLDKLRTLNFLGYVSENRETP